MIEKKFIVTTLVTWKDGEVKVDIPILFSDKEMAKGKERELVPHLGYQIYK